MSEGEETDTHEIHIYHILLDKKEGGNMNIHEIHPGRRFRSPETAWTCWKRLFFLDIPDVSDRKNTGNIMKSGSSMPDRKFLYEVCMIHILSANGKKSGIQRIQA